MNTLLAIVVVFLASMALSLLASWVDSRSSNSVYMCKAGHGLRTNDELVARRWWDKHQDCEKTLHEG